MGAGPATLGAHEKPNHLPYSVRITFTGPSPGQPRLGGTPTHAGSGRATLYAATPPTSLDAAAIPIFKKSATRISRISTTDLQNSDSTHPASPIEPTRRWLWRSSHLGPRFWLTKSIRFWWRLWLRRRGPWFLALRIIRPSWQPFFRWRFFTAEFRHRLGTADGFAPIFSSPSPCGSLWSRDRGRSSDYL